ncbi:hypothetical protein BD309DRAFT_883205 [Dichomitus squalens]|uniref:Uncharacterized protein n=1 Tax=Dichomitus squalens TaxID=114155 RepID=A0A4Q9QAH6_9APHY|nr:hypothetical protein BD309DRAFT_883205 [Dichomitus squalens]TBU64096.1 hypothetical protein BD310DRAFT_915351 [Dichomitus squalens]
MPSATQLPVILYHYDASPVARKVKHILAIKRIPHYRVEMPMTLPRPDLADRLGVKYRRIPVLAIGGDVYCDSSLIANVLERNFTPEQGFGTIFPKRKGGGTADTGMIKAFAMSYGDRTLGAIATQMLPYHKFKPDFLDDRSKWFGKKVDPQAILAGQPAAASALSSHLALVEEQLSDGREWLMDTETPSLADISVHYVWEWMLAFRPLSYLKKELFDESQFPATLAWISRMSVYIAKEDAAHKGVLDNISGERAAELITSSESADLNVVGFDEVEAARLKVKLGETIAVTPTDNGKVPTVGKLIGLTKEEVAIETRGSSGKPVHCHFPRLYYSVVSETRASKL